MRQVLQLLAPHQRQRLGFTGRKEGIAAMATATVRLPASP